MYFIFFQVTNSKMYRATVTCDVIYLSVITIMLLWYDYMMFFGTLLISLSIGIYFGCFGSKQSTTSEYLLGKRKMKTAPIAISVASSMTSIGIVSMAADVFRYGGTIFLLLVSGILLALVSIYVILPVFFKLQFTNTYDYLGVRFDNRTKQLTVCLYILGEIIFYPLLVYMPALVFSTTSGFDVVATAFAVSFLCVLYTAIGGLKTVVWTDVFQFIVMVVCIGTVFGTGLFINGGIQTVWNKAIEGERLNVFDFDPNPTKRDSFWIIIFGYTVTMGVYNVTHQTNIQKLLSIPNYKNCVRSVVWTYVAKTLMLFFSAFIGLEIYARYSYCDPLASKKIKKHDEVLTYFIMDIAEYIPGIQGLFVAAMFSASMSTMSSLLNSIAAVIYTNFVSRFLKRHHSEKRRSDILKLIVFVVGLFCTCLVFVIKHLKEVFPVAMTVKGSTGGPLMGIFFLGMVFPRSNAKGAFYGGLGGVTTLLVLAGTAKYYRVKTRFAYPSKPFSTNGCDIVNITFSNVTHPIFNSTASNLPDVPVIFKISYFYYASIGLLVTIVLGLIISYLSSPKEPCCDKNLISPVCHFLLQKYSKRVEFNEGSELEPMQSESGKNAHERKEQSIMNKGTGVLNETPVKLI